jgi:outer membrane protein OmpA-like peptidoglycan-associated protein/tetratricopeptide (TPR) repeat protein
MKLIYSFVLVFTAQFLTAQLSNERLEKLLQSGSKKDLVQASTDALLQGNWYHASLIGDKLVEMEPTNANFNYRKGRAVLSLTSDPAIALPFLTKGASEITAKYNAQSANETSSPADVLYFLAKCYHLNGDLNKAEEHYKKYLDTQKDKKNILRRYASLGLLQVANARREISAPKNYVIQNVGNPVNTGAHEYASAVALDGSALFFTSRRPWANGANAEEKDLYLNLHWEDIYVSYKTNGSWGAPQILDFCTPDNNQAMVSISKDERQVFTYKDKSGNGDIFVSNFIKGEFASLEKLSVPRINTDAWEPHFIMSPDGNTIYFVSDRDGGFGGRDIWRLERLGNGEWSRDPINMGSEINSEFDEDAPFLSFDGSTLYFSTNGPLSIGGFDIMKSIKNADGTWSAPQNMGYPLNSTGDDIFFTTVANGKLGYFTSYRKGGFGEKDLYQVGLSDEKVENVALLRGVIRNPDNTPISSDINAKLICKNCDGASAVELLPRLRDGVIIAPLEKCKEYELVYFDRATELHRESFKTTCTPEFQQIDREYIIGITIPSEYKIIGTVVNDKTNQPVSNAKVTMTSLSGKDMDKVYITDADGKFTARVLEGYAFGTEVAVSFKIEAEGYLIQNFDKSFKLGTEGDLNLGFRMIPGDGTGVINLAAELKPIYYDTDKASIRDDARVELDKIVKLLNDNPTIVMEIGSHTDCRHTAQYNMALSQRRANEAVRYIRARISNPSRVTGKGYGESQLVNNCACECEKSVGSIGLAAFKECENAQIPNCTEDQHQMNRRTEFKIVSNTAAAKSITPTIATASPDLIDAEGFYTVKEGDTIYSIARATGVLVETIMSLNDLSSPKSIKPGQRLKMR